MNNISNIHENAVLQNCQAWQSAIEQISQLNLPLHRDPLKNWNSLVALAAILKRTDKTATILDAGAESYSVILPWLSLYGYQNLLGINLKLNCTEKAVSWLELSYNFIVFTLQNSCLS